MTEYYGEFSIPGCRPDGSEIKPKNHTEQIVLTITPADDGVRCGECKWRLTGSYSNGIDWCDAFTEDSDELQKIVNGNRVERCLAAARTLREERERHEETEQAMHMRIRAEYDKTIADSWRIALEAKDKQLREEREAAARVIEAGKVMVEGWGTTDPGVGIDDIEDWDAAVAQYEAARGR